MDDAKSKNAQDPKTPAPAKKPTPPKAPVEAKIVLRGNKVMMHHLFASDVKDCLKNVSYTPNQPSLQPVPHKHFFHNIDTRGRKVTQSSMIMNHYHDVTWGMDPETGKMFAKSGPAMRIGTQRYEDGTVETMPEQVHWLDRRKKPQYDDHSHTWEYIDSEEFTANGLEARREHNRNELAAQGVNVNPTVKPLQNAVPFTKDDPATIRES